MLEEIEVRLDRLRSSGRPIDLQELDALYTSGCAEILKLEADSLRIRRRLNELRESLRHLRTAIEFLHEDEHAASDSSR
jgi:hypothetical protein